MKQKTAAKTNLIALLDTTYPGVNKLFDSPVRADGSEKWVDKPYLVYMTAGANKFLRVYYGKVKECLRNQEQAEE